MDVIPLLVSGLDSPCCSISELLNLVFELYVLFSLRDAFPSVEDIYMQSLIKVHCAYTGVSQRGYEKA